jgi:hypothetical protein
MFMPARRFHRARRSLPLLAAFGASLAVGCVEAPMMDHSGVGTLIESPAPRPSASRSTFVHAANPTGWADRAERRCEEGFVCSTQHTGELAGGVECATPSGAPYVATRC